MALHKLSIVSAVKDDDGNITEDGYYKNADGNRVDTVITLGSGKTVERYDRSKLDTAELRLIQGTKGQNAARKVCALAKEIDKRIKNLLQNPDMSLTDDERETVANFLTGTVNMATDKLEGVMEEDSGLPI